MKEIDPQSNMLRKHDGNPNLIGLWIIGKCGIPKPWHEIGHTHLPFQFGKDQNVGEEAIIEVSNMYIQNQKFGKTLQLAYRNSFYDYTSNIDDPILWWATEDDFNVNRMTEQHKKYQARGMVHHGTCVYVWLARVYRL